MNAYEISRDSTTFLAFHVSYPSYRETSQHQLGSSWSLILGDCLCATALLLAQAEAEAGQEVLTSKKEKMMQPTKIHLAMSNRTGTAQSSPQCWAIVVVHYKLITLASTRSLMSVYIASKRGRTRTEGRGRTWSEEIMVTAMKISSP